MRHGQIAAVQSLSGTGSCRLMAEFQARFMPGSKIYIPVPTWSNHHNIWRDARVQEALYRCGAMRGVGGVWVGISS